MKKLGKEAGMPSIYGKYSDVMQRYSVGRSTAVKIATAAEAKVKIGKSVICDFKKIDSYLEGLQRQQAAQ